MPIHLFPVSFQMNDPDLCFSLGEVLGSGTFGKVYRAMNTKTGEMVAIKRMEFNPTKQKQMVTQEAEHMDRSN